MTRSMRELAITRVLSLCVRTVLLLHSVFHTGISSVKADVRCYCNLPSCVASGYLCRSALGTCVSDRIGQGDLWRARHACLELLSGREGAVPCEEGAQSGGSSNYPTRRCCYEDMCNYFRQVGDVQHRRNHSYVTGYLSNDDSFFRHSGHNQNLPVPATQVWFRAAVIAVPIGGGCIMIMLIVTAARMLKADRKRHRQWAELRRRRRFLSTHVVYSGDKTVTHFLSKSVSSGAVPQGVLPPRFPGMGSASTGNLVSANGLYKNVSIAMSTDTACTDTSQDKYFVFDL